MNFPILDSQVQLENYVKTAFTSTPNFVAINEKDASIPKRLEHFIMHLILIEKESLKAIQEQGIHVESYLVLGSKLKELAEGKEPKEAYASQQEYILDVVSEYALLYLHSSELMASYQSEEDFKVFVEQIKEVFKDIFSSYQFEVLLRRYQVTLADFKTTPFMLLFIMIFSKRVADVVYMNLQMLAAAQRYGTFGSILMGGIYAWAPDTEKQKIFETLWNMQKISTPGLSSDNYIDTLDAVEGVKAGIDPMLPLVVMTNKETAEKIRDLDPSDKEAIAACIPSQYEAVIAQMIVDDQTGEEQYCLLYYLNAKNDNHYEDHDLANIAIQSYMVPSFEKPYFYLPEADITKLQVNLFV